MSSGSLTSFNRSLKADLGPLLVGNGFSVSGKRRYERAGRTQATKDIIEIQLGRGRLRGYFCINLCVERQAPDIEGNGTKWNKCFRLGSWPHSLNRIPQIVAFSPTLSLLLPVFWVSLFTDSWWRIPKSKIYLRLVMSDVTSLVSSKGFRWFASQHAKT